MKIIFKKKRYRNEDGTLAEDRTEYIDEGSTITENYNETLDSAVIRLSHLEEPLDIEPFDRVILHDEVTYSTLPNSFERPPVSGAIEQQPGIPDIPINPDIPAQITSRLADRYMCVDTYTETMESLDPVLYSYEIHLFSQTKELENYILPNLSITQSLGLNRTVWDYLQIYVQGEELDVTPKHRHSSETFIHKFSFDTTNYDFANKFNVKCPEMQWNNPTFREVLTSLMMVCDCIPVVKNNKIGYIDLTKTYNEIANTTTKHVNYVQSSQSSEDYVSELRMDMQNVMQTSLDNIKQTVSKIEYQTLRPQDGSYVVTEENMCMKVEFPILNVKHLWLTFQYIGINLGNGSDMIMFKYDLCNLKLRTGEFINIIYEKQQYDALPAQRYKADNFDQIGQANTLYFERGDNKITGFSNFYKVNWWRDINKLENLKKILINNCVNTIGQTPSYAGTVSSGEAVNRWFSTFFTIEYETTADAVFQAGKDVAPTHTRIVADNQTYSFVDAYNQGFMEYQKANRLGNKQLFINARFENDWANLIKIGDTFNNDNVIFQTQYQIYKNHIEVNATATKNYILRDYFTGVKARIRSWQIADASSSFISHRLIKYYLEFSKMAKNEYLQSSSEISLYFLSPLISTETKPLKYCFVRTKDSNNNDYPGSSEYYTLEMLGRIMGNSIVFTFGFPDNYNAPERAGYSKDYGVIQTSNVRKSHMASSGSASNGYPFDVRTGYIDDYGGIPLMNSPYVDNWGEMKQIDYFLSYDYDFPYFPTDYHFSGSAVSGSDDELVFMVYTTQYPYIYSYSLFNSFTKVINSVPNIYKDNREILKISHQFEFCSDTRDIVFTKKWLEYQECLNLGFNRTRTYVVGSSIFEPLIPMPGVPQTFWEGYINYNANEPIESIDAEVTYDEDNIVVSVNAYAEKIPLLGGTRIVILLLTTQLPDPNFQDITDYSFNISITVHYKTGEKSIIIMRDSNENYNFKNTVPSNNARAVGNNDNIYVYAASNTTAYLQLFNMSLADGETITNSVFYVGAIENGVFQTWLMLNGVALVHLNTLLSRDYNVYNDDGEVVGSIEEQD